MYKATAFTEDFGVILHGKWVFMVHKHVFTFFV